jgi:type IV secretory pathway VirB10-like protein
MMAMRGGAQIAAARRTVPVRLITLALIAALHLALLMVLPHHAGAGSDAAARKVIDLVFVRTPEKPKPTLMPEQPFRPERQAVTVKPRVHRETAFVAAPQEPAPPQAALAEPSGEPLTSSADILAHARRDIGKIDRDLRKASLNMYARDTVLTPSARERAIGSAYVGGGPPPIVEIVTNDGRRISRRGNMCAEKEHNGLVGGRDVFRDGVKTKWAECPK